MFSKLFTRSNGVCLFLVIIHKRKKNKKKINEIYNLLMCFSAATPLVRMYDVCCYLY